MFAGKELTVEILVLVDDWVTDNAMPKKKR